MKTLNEYANNKNNTDRPLNEASKEKAITYLNKIMKVRDINQVTFDELLVPLANEIDDYSGDMSSASAGTLQYSHPTMKNFLNLVYSMADDHEASVEE